MSKLNFLVLSTGTVSKHLTQAIEERGHTMERHNPNDLYLFVSQSENGYDRVYDGREALEVPVRLKAKDFDAIISRIGENLNHGSSILRHLNENLGIYCPQDADGLLTSANKLKTTQKLSFRGLRVPKTVYAKNPIHADFLMKKVDGLPAIAKMLQGSQGVGVMILETPLAANTTLESFSKQKIDLKIQKFIDAQGKDIRAIVVGGKVVVAMERTSNKGDFRANISKGGAGKKVELSEEDKTFCVNMAKAVGLEFAGVDIIKDRDGKTFGVEVNGNPGSKIVDITGHNYFVDLVKHVEAKVSKSTSESESSGKASNNVSAALELDALRMKWPVLLKGL